MNMWLWPPLNIKVYPSILSALENANFQRHVRSGQESAFAINPLWSQTPALLNVYETDHSCNDHEYRVSFLRGIRHTP